MAAISNLQESLTINFGVATSGVFPSGAGGSGSSLTIGTIRMYGFNFLPGGHADTNGGLLSIFQNTALFSLMGINFGGDGRNTFAMPDLEDNLAVGRGTGLGLTSRPQGSVFGNDQIEIQTLNLPASVNGGAQPVSNTETSTGIIWAINTGGYFPSQNGGPTEHGFLGQVQAFAVTSDFGLPRGWSEANGQALPIIGNEALFSTIGLNFGGDGSSFFLLPDLRGRVPIGIGDDVALGEKVGSEEITLTDANLPAVFGGEGAEIDNRQPGLGLNYVIATTGVFPSPGGGAADPDQAFLGEITLFAGNFAPGGFALAQGQLLPVNQFDALFSLLDDRYGGDGRTSFALPDFSERVAIDESAGNPVGTVRGENFSTIEAADLADLEEAPSLIVTTLDDVVNSLDGETSLREAVLLSNDTAGADTITFDAALAGGVLRLTQGELETTDATLINGDVDGDSFADITISGDVTGDGAGAGDSRVFSITNDRLVLYSINLDGGYAQGNGGLVSVGLNGLFGAAGSEFTNGVAVAGSGVRGYGGAIYNGGGAMYLYNSTIANNEAYSGGGININSSNGDTILVNTTIAGNTGVYGGGLSFFDFSLNQIPDVRLYHSTVTGNEADIEGGGIFTLEGGYVFLENSIVTGNAAPVGDDVSGQFSGIFNPVDATSRNIVGGQIYTGSTVQGTAASEDVFAQTLTLTGGVVAGDLDENGPGPRSVALKASLANPAIDAGTSGSSRLFTDARLELRPVDIPGITNFDNAADLGAFETQATATGDEDIFIVDNTVSAVDGDSGDDLFVVSEGDVTIVGGDGVDTFDFSGLTVPGLVVGSIEIGGQVDLSNTGSQNTFIGQKQISQIENVTGSDFADLITGDDADNVLSGGGGGDVQTGGAGNDTLDGGAGFDVVEGGAGAAMLFGGTGDLPVEGDVAAYFSSTGPLVFNFGTDITDILAGSSAEVLEDSIGADIEGVAGSTTATNTFNGQQLTGLTYFLGGSQGDTFQGGSGTDQLIGLAGNDVIYGNDGVDALIGEGGNDDLFGGTGGDFFFFSDNDDTDTVHDFEVGDALFFTSVAVSGLGDLNVVVVNADGDGLVDDVRITRTNADTSVIDVIDASLADVQAAIAF
ncbi:MAG: tail fiber protein [Paracoccaceae bacterium]